MAALRGKKPEPKSPRLKLMMYSLAGVGKTTAAIQMPAPYIVDTEAGTSHYGELIQKAGGVVYQSVDMDEVIAEVRQLMAVKHPYKTLVIDSFTPLYEAKMLEGAEKKGVGDTYGKHIAYADRYAASLFRLLSTIDVNVIVTAHAKDDWVDGEKKGIRFDGWKKLDYLFDLVLELQRRGTKRVAVVRKTRLAAFPDQEAFEWSFDALAERWGRENLVREADTVAMATAEQVTALNRKISALSIPSEEIEKWLNKAGVESFSEFTKEQIEKCHAFCDKKIAEAGNGGASDGVSA